MLSIEEIEIFISKYGESHRKWVFGAHDFWVNHLTPIFIGDGPVSKIDELRYLFDLKKRVVI